MSIKSKAFEVALHGIGPARTHEYLIIIPRLANTALVTESLTFPTLKFGEVSLSYWGEPLSFPAFEDSSGIWKIRVAESPSMFQKWEMLKQLTRQKTRSRTYFDVDIFPLYNYIPLAGVKLLNCWLKGREAVQLGGNQATEPWYWDVSFQYNGVEELIRPDNLPGVQDALLAAAHVAHKGLTKLLK